MSTDDVVARMRRFHLVRHTDPTGVSGIGVVAEGVQFTDGSIALRWRCGWPATAVWNDVDGVVAVHGHDGDTAVRWLDPPTASLTNPPNNLSQAAASLDPWGWHDDPTAPRPTTGRRP